MIQLITDRTQADVNRANDINKKVYAAWASAAANATDYSAVIDPVQVAESTLTDAEFAEWLAGLKGAYNYTDLNRVGSAVSQIAELIKTMPSEVEAYRKQKEVYYSADFLVSYNPDDVSVTPKTDWLMTDPVTPAAMTEYLRNVSNVRKLFPEGCPTVPNSMDRLTFSKANDIEKILETVHSSASALKQNLLGKIDQAALDGTLWDKYTYTEKVVYRPYATLSNFEVTFNGQTDETSITGWSGYTTEWVDLPDGKRECHYVPSGSQKTIYATGNSSSTVYTFPSPYKVEAHALFLINGVPKRQTSESTVTTTQSTSTIYSTDRLVGTVKTQGYAYPDGVSYPLLTREDNHGEVYELVGGGYYYIRRK